MHGQEPFTSGESHGQKVIVSAGLGAALLVGGAGSAQAWTWASSSSPIVFSGGGGYGNVNFGGVSYTLQSWLRDTVRDDGRVYAQIEWVHGAQGLIERTQSGRRADGEASYARMSDVLEYTDYGTGTYRYTAQTCRTASLNDPCSTDKRTLN